MGWGQARSHPPAGLQQDHGVEGLEDLDGRLVDGDHHGAPVAGHILDGLHDDDRRACVQPARWLVHEDDGRIGNHLDACAEQHDEVTAVRGSQNAL